MQNDQEAKHICIVWMLVPCSQDATIDLSCWVFQPECASNLVQLLVKEMASVATLCFWPSQNSWSFLLHITTKIARFLLKNCVQIERWAFWHNRLSKPYSALLAKSPIEVLEVSIVLQYPNVLTKDSRRYFWTVVDYNMDNFVEAPKVTHLPAAKLYFCFFRYTSLFLWPWTPCWTKRLKSLY